MLGFYEGYHNGLARPITGEQWSTLNCKDCGVPQTHHKDDGAQWRCVICSAIKDGKDKA